MNKRCIKAQLNRVLADLAKSIDDSFVKSAIQKGTIITGGAMVSLLTGEKPNDYDLYFKDFETCWKVAEYYVKKWNESRNGQQSAELRIKIKTELGENVKRAIDGKEQVCHKWVTYEEALQNLDKEPRIMVFISSNGVTGEQDTEDGSPLGEEMKTNVTPDSDVDKELEENPKYQPKFLTSNAISLSGKIQLVIRFYGNPEEIHKNYDFVHCTNYWTSWDNTIVLRPEALESIINKELIYTGSKYPLCSIIRTRKFIKRGWTIHAGQYLKMAMQLNELNLSDVEVLEEQLVGVDSTYFAMLIEALKSKQTSDPQFKVNGSYVASIVDKLF